MRYYSVAITIGKFRAFGICLNGMEENLWGTESVALDDAK